MNHLLSYQEAFQILRREGFEGVVIDRFYQLRRGYLTSEMDQPPLDLRHLEFARWLVATGRITDDFSEEQSSTEVPPETWWSQFKHLLTCFWRGEWALHHRRGKEAGRQKQSSLRRASLLASHWPDQQQWKSGRR